MWTVFSATPAQSFKGRPLRARLKKTEAKGRGAIRPPSAVVGWSGRRSPAPGIFRVRSRVRFEFAFHEGSGHPSKSQLLQLIKGGWVTTCVLLNRSNGSREVWSGRAAPVRAAGLAAAVAGQASARAPPSSPASSWKADRIPSRATAPVGIRRLARLYAAERSHCPMPVGSRFLLKLNLERQF